MLVASSVVEELIVEVIIASKLSSMLFACAADATDKGTSIGVETVELASTDGVLSAASVVLFSTLAIKSSKSKTSDSDFCLVDSSGLDEALVGLGGSKKLAGIAVVATLVDGSEVNDSTSEGEEIDCTSEMSDCE